MHISKFPFDKISALSSKDTFYQLQTEKLKDFLSFTPDKAGLETAFLQRKKNDVDRELLVSVLSEHYEGHVASEKQYHNIYKLSDPNTFTLVTAHQPSLLGGPAYYFYKICSVIHLADQMNTFYPGYHFVPVFVSGSEDHDFDEVKSLHMYGKNIVWNTDQTGPVGRFKTSGLREVLDTISNILGTNENAEKISQTFNEALEKAKDYNEFVFFWLNHFFKDYGLLVVNMDDKRLKKSFSPIIKKEILERKSVLLVQDTQEKLLELGFKPQAFARDINVFYMTDGSRERIYFENDRYIINNTNISFSESEIIQEIDNFPERFSPNVVLRPLYQESTLPNIAYIGGGGEIAYWLERKSQFEYFDVFFPVLIRRNSVMLVPKSIVKTLDKLSLKLEDLLLDEDKIITKYLEMAANGDFHLNIEVEEIKEVFSKISAKAKLIDATLEPFVLGEGQKISKSIEAIESRLKRTLKQKEDTSINQIKSVKSKLFPENGLQERKESLLPYLASEDKDFLSNLIQNLNPLDKEFLFIYL